MKDEDKEIWIGDSKLYLNNENMLMETIVGDTDERIALEFEVASLKMKRNIDGKTNVLIDLSNASKSTSDERRLEKQELEDERIGKVALFGLHPVARVIASFVMGVTKKDDMRFFKTKEEALAWLKE